MLNRTWHWPKATIGAVKQRQSVDVYHSCNFRQQLSLVIRQSRQSHICRLFITVKYTHSIFDSSEISTSLTEFKRDGEVDGNLWPVCTVDNLMPSIFRIALLLPVWHLVMAEVKASAGMKSATLLDQWAFCWLTNSAPWPAHHTHSMWSIQLLPNSTYKLFV